MHEKGIEKLQAEKEKVERAHRLITRGAAIESVAPQTKDLSESAFYAFAEQVFALPDTQGLSGCSTSTSSTMDWVLSP